MHYNIWSIKEKVIYLDHILDHKVLGVFKDPNFFHLGAVGEGWWWSSEKVPIWPKVALMVKQAKEIFSIGGDDGWWSSEKVPIWPKVASISK